MLKEKPLKIECRVCNKNYPFTEEYFFKDIRSRFGLQYICKECRKKDAMDRHYSKYNLSANELNLLRKEKKCFICGKETKLVIDHDHKTGKVRGMLCDFCNKGIGHFFDNVAVLKNAISYLDKWDC